MRHPIGAAFLLTMTAIATQADAQVSVDDRLAVGEPSIIIAHRTADLGGVPENSLAAIRAAIDERIDMLHINPEETSDGEYILMHDTSLNRMTDVETVFPEGPAGGPGRTARGGKDFVRDYTLTEIRRLHLRDERGVTEEPVPTLREAIQAADGRIMLLLGLKGATLETLVAHLSGLDTGNLMFFDLYYSGSPTTPLGPRSAATGIPASIAFLNSTDQRADLERHLAASGPAIRMICVKSRQITPDFLQLMAERDLKVCISGWNGREDSALIYKDDPGPWRTAIEAGYAVLTDRPVEVRGLRDD